MKALRIAAGVAAAAGVLAIAGCPLFPGLTPTTPTFEGYPADAKLTGRFTFDGKAPPAVLTAEYKVPGGDRSTEKATADALGYFSFKGATAGSKYQIIWDDHGEEVTASNVNTIGLYVSDVVTAQSPLTDSKAPMVTLDLKWEPNPTPAPGATITKGTATSFSFTAIPNLDATYQISLFGGTKTAVGPTTATSSTSPISIDTSALGTGDNYYQIKFFKKGGTFGGQNFYGSTKFYKIKI